MGIALQTAHVLMHHAWSQVVLLCLCKNTLLVCKMYIIGWDEIWFLAQKPGHM